MPRHAFLLSLSPAKPFLQPLQSPLVLPIPSSSANSNLTLTTFNHHRNVPVESQVVSRTCTSVPSPIKQWPRKKESIQSSLLVRRGFNTCKMGVGEHMSLFIIIIITKLLVYCLGDRLDSTESSSVYTSILSFETGGEGGGFS